MLFARGELADGFRRLGVRAGDTVMLHASVRAVGRVAGGPDQIHLALADALTPQGTLMMYASCPQGVDDVGRGHLSVEDERELLEKMPPFDPRTARSERGNGALVEFFRTYPGTLVNAHPARFAVRGRRACEFTADGPWDFAFGYGSALDRFVQADGRILLLGCDHDHVTFLHYAEHIVDVPHKRIVTCKVPVEEKGVRVWKDMQEYDTSEGAHPHWPDRFFAWIVDTYLSRSGNSGARVGDAQAFLIDARGLLDFALDVMRAVAADPTRIEVAASSRTSALRP